MKQRIKNYLVEPFARFVRLESFGGILLFIATGVALLWANFGAEGSYSAFWSNNIIIGLEPIVTLDKPLLLWINDGLMALFFFLIGLEIKRELLAGELNSIRSAMLPLFAAIGGMSFPVLTFFILNNDPVVAEGWAIPIATDIAFSLAVLKMLGKRIDLNVKLFLTAFAIVDDIGAVMVIAIFYSDNIQWLFAGAGMLIIGFLLILTSFRIYFKYLTLLCGVVVWVLFLKSGIHPTLAGVLMAFTIPIGRRTGAQQFFTDLKRIGQLGEQTVGGEKLLLSGREIGLIDHADELVETVQSPLQYLEHKLHAFVAYFILPLFALANAGIILSTSVPINIDLATVIAICLVIGNPIGISLMVFIALKLGVTQLPPGMNFPQVVGIGFLAGIGFTMSIFISNLAFGDPLLIESSKLGILAGSLIAGSIGFFILRFSTKGGVDQ